jgi:hypothetical protein
MKTSEPSVAVQWLLKKWDEETRLLSNIEEMMKYPANEILYKFLCPWNPWNGRLAGRYGYVCTLQWALENDVCVLQSMNLLFKLFPDVKLKYSPGDVKGTQDAWLEYLNTWQGG